MELRLMRAVYAMEFLVGIVATFQFWSQVGGQAHLDLMPWWLKAGISLAVAASIVRLTMAGGRRQILTRGTALALLLIATGVITYYFHLYEPQDDMGDEDQVTPTSLKLSSVSLLPDGDLDLPRSVRGLHYQSAVVL